MSKPPFELKPVDFIGAVLGIAIIGLGQSHIEAPDASAEWWREFAKLYSWSIVPFGISCGMIGKRAGRSWLTAFYGVLAAMGVFLVAADALNQNNRDQNKK